MGAESNNRVVVGAVTGTRAATYARQSKGYLGSIDDQEREILEVCGENGWTVVTKYRDKVSASRHGTKARDDWPKIVKEIEAGKLDLLVTWEISRADRDLETWIPFLSTCRRMGVRIHVKSAEITYDPRKAAHYKALAQGGLDAAAEIEVLRERSLRGIAGALLAGKQSGSPAYGFDRRYDPADRKTFTEVPNGCAPVAIEIIERVAREDPIVHIERDLNGDCTVEGCKYVRLGGIPSPTGERWLRQTIRFIATNPAYIGMRRHHGTVHPGNWGPIVDESVFNDAQKVLRDPKRKTTKPGRGRWLLSYLATAPCGGYVKVEAPGGKRGQRRTPRCIYRCDRDGCIGIGMLELDEYVTRVVLARLAEPDARALFERSGEEAEAARLELAKLTVELEEWRASADEPDGISAVALARKERALEPLIEHAQKRIVDTSAPAALQALIPHEPFMTELVHPEWYFLSARAKWSVIIALVQSVTVCPVDERLTRWAVVHALLMTAMMRLRWNGLSVAARRSVISALVESISVRLADERLSRWSSPQDRVRLARERTRIVPRGSEPEELVA